MQSISDTRYEDDLTHNHAQATPRRMGRKKLWHEAVNLTLPEGAKAEMDSALQPGEDRLELIRAAIAREMKRRKSSKAERA